jgi:hypothetical protein
MATKDLRDPSTARTTSEQLRNMRGSRPTAAGSLRWSFVIAALLVSAFAAAPAQAKPEFPGELQKMLAATKTGVCTPSCMLCHTDPAGGGEYVRTTLNKSGVAWPGSIEIILLSKNAQGLANLKDEDTDGDTISDLDELLAGTDPLVKGTPSICAPEYGCGARVAPAPRSYRGAAGVAALFAAAVAAYFVRRPRHAARPEKRG